VISSLRLVSGLILFVFVLGHFSNHALGIISLSAMNSVLWLTIQPWREPVGAAILIVALLVHMALALKALFARGLRHLKTSDLLQLFTGFAIPFLITVHVLATRGAYEAFGIEEGYEYTLYGLTVSAPTQGFINAAALAIVWVHACIGWRHWFKLYSWYEKAAPWLLGLAVLFPTLALAGYVSASLRVLRLSNNESWVENLLARSLDKRDALFAWLQIWDFNLTMGFAAAIGLALAARWSYGVYEGRRSGVLVRYQGHAPENHALLRVPANSSLLECLNAKGISHASVCGGRARCSTCRVRVDAGLENLPDPDSSERKLLKRIAAPPSIRLACQMKPRGTVSVTALLDPGIKTALPSGQENLYDGSEQEIAVLFADIRGFTKLAETRLPYDTAFLLNRYFAAMGEAIEEAGGHVDKFIGDGVMALFGLDRTLPEACRNALEAARLMSVKLEEMNRTTGSDLREPLRIGIGIHCGTALVGTMGYGKACSLTAIGDVVNTASRLEEATKHFSTQLVISKKTWSQSGLDTDGFGQDKIAIRGRNEPLDVLHMSSAATLKDATEVLSDKKLMERV